MSEETVVQFGAPTLAGIKTGSLFSLFGPLFFSAPLRYKDDSLPSFSAGELYLRRGCSLFLSRLFDPLKSYQPYGIIAYIKGGGLYDDFHARALCDADPRRSCRAA